MASFARKTQRERNRKLDKWFESPNGRLRLMMIDMTRAGVAAQGIDIIGRNMILTVKYDPDLHARNKHKADMIPDNLDDPQVQRWWIIGSLCNLFKARLRPKELMWLHEIYLVLLEPDGSAREVAQGNINAMVDFARRKDSMTAEEREGFIQSFRFKQIDRDPGLKEVLKIGERGIEISN